MAEVSEQLIAEIDSRIARAVDAGRLERNETQERVLVRNLDTGDATIRLGTRVSLSGLDHECVFTWIDDMPTEHLVRWLNREGY